MTLDDARRAVERGVDIIWVSNPGGRQLDQAQGTIEARPPIVDAVAGAATVVVDRASAVAPTWSRPSRDASLVAIGRTALWGLAADGATGVARVIEILREEISTALALSGQTGVRGLKPAYVLGRLTHFAD